MTEVKAAVLTLAAAAVFLIATVVGVGSRTWRDPPVPTAVRVGAVRPALGLPEVPATVVDSLAGKEGSSALVPSPSLPETDRSVGSMVPALPEPQQAPAPVMAPNGVLALRPALSVGPFLPVPPPVVPSPEPTAPPPVATEVPADPPAPTSEIVARPVQTGQVDEYDDEDDTASASSANNHPDDGGPDPGSGRSGRGSGRGSDRGK